MKYQLFIIAALLCGIWAFHSHNNGNGISPNNREEEIKLQEGIVEQQMDQIVQQLKRHQLRNADILIAYAEQLKKQKPELTTLINNLEKDATVDNPAYKSLEDRLDAVEDNPKTVGNGSPDAILEELTLLKAASNPLTYNDSLIDTVNVLADLSGGTLSRINAPPKAAESSISQPGSQLVGNPNYGNWHEHDGMSFWEWYGAYSMFNNLFGYHNYSYNSWAEQRPWSYYNDYGRDLYASRAQRSAFESVDQRAFKTYNNGGTRRPSIFSKRTNGDFTANSISPMHVYQNVGSSYNAASSIRMRRSSSYSRRH